MVEAIDAHRAWLAQSGVGAQRRAQRARSEIQGIALAAVQARFAGLGHEAGLDALAADVAEGRTDAFTAAETLVAAIGG